MSPVGYILCQTNDCHVASHSCGVGTRDSVRTVVADYLTTIYQKQMYSVWYLFVCINFAFYANT